MNISDFEYDGQRASDLGLKVCKFDSPDGIETNSAGSEINFNMTSVGHGEIQLIPDITYDSVITATFQVCKFIDCKVKPFTFEEQRNMARWLNRKEVHLASFCGLSDETESYDYIEFEGSFNLSEVKIKGAVYGYELNFISNRPFALGRSVRKIINASTSSFKYKMYDESDEIGHVYPTKLVIKCKSAGNLTIHNDIEDRTTSIKNCANGEVITFDNLMNITTTVPSHKIQNDFNFRYFRIANTYQKRLNTITISIPCEITIEYSPIIKGVGL